MNISRPSCLTASLILSTASLVLCGAAGGTPATSILLAAQEAAAATKQVELNPSHPDRYVVKRGDTLWDIAAMFLKDPWYWPEIWYVNPQIENPHLIYPGDVLTLAYVNGKPRVEVQRAATVGKTEKLSPRIREQSLESAIPTIPLEVIGAFLGRGSILQKDEWESAPYVVAIRDNHLMAGAGNDLYVRGDIAGLDQGYSVVHIGDKLRDPDDGAVVGYQGIYVGGGTIRRLGDPATLFLNESSREAHPGDRLISQQVTYPANFIPSAPSKPIQGSIMAVVDGITQVGQYQVIVINRGTRDGLVLGNVLSVWQKGQKVPDRVSSGVFPHKVKLPDEPAGTSMVFRTYDRVSYALIMEATSEIHVLDTVKSPD